MRLASFCQFNVFFLQLTKSEVYKNRRKLKLMHIIIHAYRSRKLFRLFHTLFDSTKMKKKNNRNGVTCFEALWNEFTEFFFLFAPICRSQFHVLSHGWTINLISEIYSNYLHNEIRFNRVPHFNLLYIWLCNFSTLRLI